MFARISCICLIKKHLFQKLVAQRFGGGKSCLHCVTSSIRGTRSTCAERSLRHRCFPRAAGPLERLVAPRGACVTRAGGTPRPRPTPHSLRMAIEI